MAQPTPKTVQEIRAFRERLARGAAEDFPGLDPIKLDEFKAAFMDLSRPGGIKQMVLPWTPLWALILTSFLGVRWGVLFWLLGIIWLVAVNIGRMQQQKKRWNELMQRGREYGILE